ncbi:histidine kinase [Methylomonas methanica]|uniref:Integral membrane sensor signal transduction histidine kinase n=1 Tax=Methylomonas methanica (strain DSM 25384 / MC09) TaxID=857087 RepID=G0A495_METMM|nr:histidine kinase [Methylomonas methanica]AEG00311.1 integral membrane sensor signal transduction histidine kinase [Methylomonas methanica MC09]
MNLQLHLLSRISAIALACLLLVSAYVLFQSHRQAELAAWRIADSQGRLLESQLMLHSAGIGQSNPFPDFEVWKQSGSQPGICLRYAAADNTTTRSLCNGTKPAIANWPILFETGYRWFFNPGRQTVRPIALRGRVHGSLTVTPSAELELAAAWDKFLQLTTLSCITIFAVSALVYLSIRRALRPAHTIVQGVETLEAGRFDFRLPDFQLNEWRHIGAAINQLAASQQQLLAERQRLVTKLITLQEAERRYLTRELHDEFGQCLAAIQAISLSIRQTAIQQCPELISETEHINRITGHMMTSLRRLLGQLRPAEFDELGLAASLNSLVAGWNGRSRGNTRFQLDIYGDCTLLSETQAINLFRIAQACLTNISKHAKASSARIHLQIDSDSITLLIQDDGIADHLPFADTDGIGLLGIRERATALHGQLTMSIAQPHGLIVKIELPASDNSE